MTGRSAIAVQNTRFSAPLAAEYKVFPQILKEQGGYFSGVAGRTFHLDGAAVSKASRDAFAKYGLQTFERRLDFVKQASGSKNILAQFREFLDAVPKGKPFVLQLSFNDPHRPLDKDAIPKPHDPTSLKLPPFYPDTKLVREDFARYYDEIARFDRDVGDVLAELAKRGLSENTLVAVSGDNGCSQWRGKGTLYEFGIHCPLIVRWPGKVKPGTSTEELISGEDFAPTFLEAAGVAAPKEMSGVSFLKLLKGEKFEGRKYVFAQRGAHGSGLPTNSAAFDLGRCVVGNQYKLIYNCIPSLPFWPVDFAGDAMWKEVQQMHVEGKLAPELSKLYFSPTRPLFEFYDLKNDPYELKNLEGQAAIAPIEQELKEALHEWMILQRDFVPLPIDRDSVNKKKKGKD
jgi:arylsulfatase A-like enzyme